MSCNRNNLERKGNEEAYDELHQEGPEQDLSRATGGRKDI